mgnify:CR=1 FL=1
MSLSKGDNRLEIRNGGSMNIIICDDSQRDRENLIELLKSYAKEKEQKNA